ncbi:hypothetical protein [Pelodictyon phaeoclathratiforme]|uniref:hypothetical protein n=1 Tax=Pelodictyon phaeoclathratiforme TaxID=34090 RepID=UPI000310B198|nr:hypothetical protein [Pelodictyon phaeoclathratiforme]MBV5289252.1 hypothetical protein [Pelodictyon phaeoclathratiforme]
MPKEFTWRVEKKREGWRCDRKTRIGQKRKIRLDIDGWYPHLYQGRGKKLKKLAKKYLYGYGSGA